MIFAFSVRRTSLGAVFAVLTLFPASNLSARQQPSPAKKASSETPQKSSRFADVEQLLREGKLTEAQSRLEAELQQNPASAEGYALLGVVFSEEKNFPEAIKAFEHSLKLDPRSSKARNSLGNIHVIEGNLDLAEKEFRESVRLNPTGSAGNYNLGWCCSQNKNQPKLSLTSRASIHPASNRK